MASGAEFVDYAGQLQAAVVALQAQTTRAVEAKTLTDSKLVEQVTALVNRYATWLAGGATWGWPYNDEMAAARALHVEAAALAKQVEAASKEPSLVGPPPPVPKSVIGELTSGLGLVVLGSVAIWAVVKYGMGR